MIEYNMVMSASEGGTPVYGKDGVDKRMAEKDALLRKAVTALSIATIEDDTILAERYRGVRDELKQHLVGLRLTAESHESDAPLTTEGKAIHGVEKEKEKPELTHAQKVSKCNAEQSDRFERWGGREWD